MASEQRVAVQEDPSAGGEPDSEGALRTRLGIPADAERVMVLVESGHRPDARPPVGARAAQARAAQAIDRVVDALLREPRRVFELESVAFLRRYWDQAPDRRQTLRALVDQRRLQIGGLDVTSTLIPGAEVLLRLHLADVEWLRGRGMTSAPRLARLPASGGHSPALPSLLQAMGCDRVVLTGAGDPAGHQGPHPRARGVAPPGDFVWRDANGAEVLAHLSPLAGRGLRVVPATIPWGRSGRAWDRGIAAIAHRFTSHAERLAAHRLTPYVLCPVTSGGVRPIPDLLTLCDRVNARHFPASGLWLVNAGLDDYLALVGAHRDRLPTLVCDPPPGARRIRTPVADPVAAGDLVDTLLLVEALAGAAGVGPAGSAQDRAVAEALVHGWETVARAHRDDGHRDDGRPGDGTAAGAGSRGRQTRPGHALQAARAALARLEGAPDKPLTPPPVDPARVAAPRAALSWRREGGTVEVRAPWLRAVLDSTAGGCVVRAWDPRSGEPLLTGPSADLVSHRGPGRRHGTHEVDRTSGHPAHVTVTEHGDTLIIGVRGHLEGQAVCRWLWLRADLPVIRFRVEVPVVPGGVRTLRFAPNLVPTHVRLDVPGGIATRPVPGRATPPWCLAQSFLQVTGTGPRWPGAWNTAIADGGVVLGLARPGWVAVDTGGRLEVTIADPPARHRAGEPVTFDGALWFPAPGTDAGISGLRATARRALLPPAASGRDTTGARLRARLDEITGRLVTVDRGDVVISALKPAARGGGLIVRLRTLDPAAVGQPVRLTLRPGAMALQGAWRCDAAERDRDALACGDGHVDLVMPGSLATIRLVAR